MRATETSRTRLRAVLVLAILVVAAYGLSLRNELVFDDMIFMQHDPRLRSLAGAARLFVEPLWGFSDDDGRSRLHQYYRPLQTLPLALSYAAFGEAAWPSHVLNLALHLATAVLAFELYLRLTGGATAALLAAALFAVHPGYSEAVLWISNVAGLGAAACTLLIVLLHIAVPRGRRMADAAIAGLFLLGLWFKEAGVLAPVLMLLYDLLVAPDRGWPRLRRLWPRYVLLVPPLAVYYALRQVALGGILPGFESVTLTRTELAVNAVALLPQYVQTFVWPVDLNMYHDFNAIHDVWNARFWGGAAIVTAALLIAAATARARPVIAFGALWMLVTAAPHLLIRWPQLNVYAERYLYLPAVGAFLVMAALAARAAPRLPRPLRHAAVVATVVLVVAGASAVIRRTPDWHDEVSIYSKTLTQSPRAELIRNNLALRYLELGRYDEGIELLRELLAFDASWVDAWHNLGLLYLAKGMEGDAITAFEGARQRDPMHPSTLLNLGYLYDRAGRREEAVQHYFRVLRVQPDSSAAWYNLAVVASELGQLRNARAAAERVLAHAPEDGPAAELLRRVRAASARLAAAAAPADTERRCAAARQMVDEGRYADALVTLQAAAWFDEMSPLPHHYLANAYYLSGRLAEATRHQREALQRAPGNELYRRNLAALESDPRAPNTPNKSTRTSTLR